MSTSQCPHCDRANYMYLSKCRKCGIRFCDRCEEAAAALADTVAHSSATVTMYEPVCPSCGAKDVDLGAG